MPIYDFKCTKCDTVTTELRKYSNESDEAKCHKCGEVAIKQLTVPGMFEFKGVSFSASAHMK